MHEKLYKRNVERDPLSEESEWEEVGFSPIEGVVIRSCSQNHHMEMPKGVPEGDRLHEMAHMMYRGGFYNSLLLNLEGHEDYTYRVLAASFRLDVGERVRLFPVQEDTEHYRLRHDNLNIGGLQVLNERGEEIFRYEGKDTENNFRLMTSPDDA